jgi:hypothetical protein
MSALKQVFVRVHLRYEQDRYAEDLVPDFLGPPLAGRIRWHGTELTRWLRRL